MKRIWLIIGMLAVSTCSSGALPEDAVRAGQEGRWATALDLWQKASRESPEDVDIVAELGWAEMENGLHADARRRFQRAMRLSPNHLRASVGLVTLSIRELKGDEALRYAQAAVQAHPRSAGAHRALGDAHKAMSNRAEAETAYRKAVLLDPKDARNHAGLGDALMLRRKGEEALKSYREAARLDATNGPYLEGAARAAMQAMRYGEAAVLFSEAVDLARTPVPDWPRIDSLSLLLIDTLGRTTTAYNEKRETRQNLHEANTRALSLADTLSEVPAVRDADVLLNPGMAQRSLAYSLLGQACASELGALEGSGSLLSADAVVFREQSRRAIVTARAAELPVPVQSR